MAELLKELQAAEGILGHAKSAQIAEKGSSSPSAKKNKKKKKLTNQVVLSQSRNPRKVELSLKTHASPAVRHVIGRNIIPSTKLKLKMASHQVCLFV